MADGIEITFEGLAEFDHMMIELAGPAADRTARKAVRSGGQIVQAAIAERAPVRAEGPSGTALPPGALKSDIEIHTTKEDDGSMSAYVEPGKYTLHVARFVEYGHRDVHGGRYGRGGNHTGFVPAHPFVRPGFEASAAEAETAMAETIATEVGKEARNLGAS